MADVMELIKQHEADMIGIRRHIHANPTKRTGRQL